MDKRSLLFAMCLGALGLSGCNLTGPDSNKFVYFTRPPGQRVGVREACPRYYNPPQTGYKITAPSVGYGGVSVNLGSYEIDPAQMQNVSELLTFLDQSRWTACCGIRDAAEAGDWARYDRLTAAEDSNADKITQAELILAAHPAAQKDSGAPDKDKARAALTQDLAKWTDSYGSAGQHMAGVQAKTAAKTATLLKDVNTGGAGAMGHAMTTGTAMASAPATPAPAATPAPTLTKPQAVALAVPTKSNAFFNLPPPPAKPAAPQ